MHVKNIGCAECGTEISGDYAFPLIVRLSASDQEFITKFISCSGSLKEMASRLGVSYPTVRNRLDEIIDRMKTLGEETGDE